MSYPYKLANVLILDKIAELRENLEWLESYGIVETRDIDNLQRLLDTLRKLVKLQEEESNELVEKGEESQGTDC